MSDSIDRRTFLHTTGAALAGAAASQWLGGQSAARAGQFTGKIKKAVKYHMIREDLSVMDKFKLMADLGFDGVEPRTRDARKIGPKEMVRASEATGVRIHGVVGAGPDIAKAIDLSKSLGGTSVLLTLPPAPNGSYMENYKKRQENVRQAIPHAQKQGIELLIENVWSTFLIAPPLMAQFIDELDSDMVGSYFDVGNVLRWGHPQHWVQVLGNRIQKLDIKDYHVPTAMKDGMRAGFCKIGEGSTDWGKVRNELSQINFTGWATAENRGGDRERLADIARRMDKVLDL